MAAMEFWTKDPTPGEIEAIVASNIGQLVDGGDAALRACLQDKVNNRVLAPGAEATCMGAMEAGFWTKQSKEKKSSCDGVREAPFMAGMLSALWANACDEEEDDENDNEKSKQKKKDDKDDDKKDKKDDKKDEKDDKHKPQHSGGGCSC
jgi:hypothetical protein